MRRRRVALVPGDGIGAEVMPVASALLDDVAARHGFVFEFFTMPWGEAHRQAAGTVAPPDALEGLLGFEAVLLGAALPARVGEVSLDGLIREGLGHTVRIRPVQAWPGLPSPLRRDLLRSLDGLLVTSAAAPEVAERLGEGPEPAVRGVCLAPQAATALARRAFAVAGRRPRRKLLAVLDPPPHGPLTGMWVQALEAAARGVPEVDWRAMPVGEVLGALLLHPRAIDVLVAPPHLVGLVDGLLDVLQGGACVPAVASLNPAGSTPPLLAPTHGPRLDLAGHRMANPLGIVWACALLLDALGERAASSDVLRAIARVAADGVPRTPDIGGSASTDEMCLALRRALHGEGSLV